MKSGVVRLVLMHPPLLNVLTAATPDYIDENRGLTPPMGLLYLLAAVERSKHEPIFLDANLEGWNHEQAARKALESGPDLIGIQAMTFTLLDACLTAKAIKELSPSAKILFGGPHPTIYPSETATLDWVDFAFAGEGEFDFVNFLDVFGDTQARAAVRGIASKDNGGIRYTQSRGLLLDLDAIPFPARKSTPYKRYFSVLAKRNPNTVMITSRGCPFNCIFCNRMGRKYRMHSAPYVLREFDEIASLGIREVFIHDDTFTINRERVKAICAGLVQRGYDLIWEARTRVDCVDKELLELMRRAGCHRISFGVESGSPKVLKSMRKGIELNQVKSAFEWCRKEGIETLADFMLGNLDEQDEDVEMTLALMGQLHPDYVQFSILSPYPGTPLYQMAMERGIVEGDVWLEFAKNPLKRFCTPIWTEHFTEEKLRRITRKAYRSFYLRPSFIWKQVQKIKSSSQFMALVRSGLGMIMER